MAGHAQPAADSETTSSSRPAIPNDPKLPRLSELFDAGRAWARFCDTFGAPDQAPDRVQIAHFVYRPGSRAVVGYVAERDWDGYVAEEQFAIELRADGSERLFRFPDDPYLPGLAHVADPLKAHELLPQHVALHPQRLAIERVRYRPTTKAVLRHFAHWRRKDAEPALLYVRAMPPATIERFLTAGRLAAHSGFVLPRLAGCNRELGVAWLANVPGKTLRQLIAQGGAPAPDQVLDALAPLWEYPPGEGQPLNLMQGFRHSRGVLSGALPEGAQHPTLRKLLAALRPFAESWRPSSLAHNDFYDDQMIVTPEGRIALVDFEETGPGDPLMDVGTMLAHLCWMAHFVERTRYGTYGEELRRAALDRFGWERRQVDVAQAFLLYRLASNPIRHFKDGSLQKVETVLSLALETLES